MEISTFLIYSKEKGKDLSNQKTIRVNKGK
jgi:hypothetical protein